MLLISSNFERTSVLTQAPPWTYDRKTAAWPFETIHDILWRLSLVQSLLKAARKPNLVYWERGGLRAFLSLVVKFFDLIILFSATDNAPLLLNWSRRESRAYKGPIRCRSWKFGVSWPICQENGGRKLHLRLKLRSRMQRLWMYHSGGPNQMLYL